MLPIAAVQATVQPIVTLIAVGVAIWAAMLARQAAARAHRDHTVSKLYGDFGSLARLRIEYWPAAHLLELPETYEAERARLEIALGRLGAERQQELLIRERGVALAIFSLFEETCYHRAHAESARDAARLVFLDDTLEYFTGRLLMNPRLRYLWRVDGANLRAYLEPHTRLLYESRCLPESADGDGPARLDIDPVGPYLLEGT
jgi:hypothetical protein